MIERKRPSFALCLFLSFLTLGIYVLVELKNEEREIEEIVKAKLKLPTFSIQVLLSYLTLFLYKQIRIDLVLMKVRSDYLILAHVDPRITEAGYRRCLYSLLYTLGLSSCLLAYLSYKQHDLFLRVHKRKLRNHRSGFSLYRDQGRNDVVYFKPYKKKKRRPHLDYGDVLYFKDKEEEIERTEGDVVLLERRTSPKALKMKR